MDIWQAAQARAFTVAKAMRLDILQTIRDELQTVLDEGMMLRDFQKDLEPKLKALGWWGNHEIVDADGVVSSVQLGSPWRLRTIYETNMRTSYEAGSYREMMESMDDAPYGQFMAVLDQNTRPTHRALNGLVFRLDDPFWDTHWPPLDWGCRCSVRQLSDRDVAKRRLTISEGAGHLTDHETMVNGEPATVTVYSAGNIRVATGPGWNYNPGKVDWQPNLDKYDTDISKLW
jgi:SPP1 gp7 family putative phage head morphogenesis protein